LLYGNEQRATKDLTEAAKWYTLAANQGHAGAQFCLGQMYRQGWGVTKNEEEAVKCLTKAAEQGHTGAQFWLGIMYQEGVGGTKDLKKAVEYYTLAAKQEHEVAHNCLKDMACKGNREALDNVREMAEQEYADAQFWLGWMYRQGRGVTKDLTEAVKWLTKAAKKGHVGALNNLTEMAEQGDAGAQNNLGEGALHEIIKRLLSVTDWT
jgi:TPR repeat protein